MAWRSPRIVFWGGAIFALACTTFAQEHHAEPPAAATLEAGSERVDLVLVIDASGSMLLTDPLKVRFEGAKLVSQFLKPGDRLAIVGFDKDARVLRPLTPFKASESADIATAIEQVGNSGEYTNILAGVRAAKEILDKGHDKKAEPVVILLSDGKMEPAPEAGTAAQQTDVLLNEYLPDLKAGGIKIHTLAFSERADRGLLSEIALATEGTKLFVPEAEDLQQAYTELFMSVKKPQVLPLTSKGFKIDSGILEATFYINREGSDQPLSLKNPSGETETEAEHSDSIKWFVGKKFDVITITEPAPGDWQVVGMKSTDSFATVLTNLKLITEWPTAFTVDAPVVLRARLYENEKPVILPEMAGATKYAFEIIPTDRIAEPIVREFLHDDGADGDKIARDGIFSYRLPITEVGEYRLRVIARAPTFQRSQQVAFRVKPRLITLTIEQDEEHGGGGHDASGAGDHGHGHGDEAAPAAHGDEHGAESPRAEHTEAGHGSSEKETPAHGPQSFRITLSPEGQAVRKAEVKLVAIASDGKRYVVPTEGHGGEYHAYPRSLPFEGEYTLVATLTGEGRKKEHINEESPKVTYRKRKGDEAEAQAEILVVEKAPDPSTLPYILVVLLLNGGLGGTLFVMLKRQVGGTTIELPKFPPATEATEAIAFLEEKLKLVDIDVNEAIYTSNDPVLLPGESSGVGTAAAPSAAATESPPNAPAAAPEPAEDDSAPPPPPPAPAEETPPEEAKE